MVCGVAGSDRLKVNRAVRVEARIDTPQRLEAAQHQSRPDQEHEGERHFDGDECPLGPMASPTGPATRFPEDVLHVGVRTPHRGCKTEHDGCEEARGHREDQDSAVDRDIIGPRERAWQKGQGRASAGGRQQKPERPPECGENDALREELPHQARAARAQCDANGELP